MVSLGSTKKLGLRFKNMHRDFRHPFPTSVMQIRCPHLLDSFESLSEYGLETDYSVSVVLKSQEMNEMCLS